MALTWDKSLATGSPTVDRQHQTLFEQIAALGDAMAKGEGRTEVGRILDFLGQYVERHFAEEEKLMADVACPVAAANKLAHAQFLAKFGDIKKRFDQAGAGVSMVLDVNEMLTDWLVKHIRGIDMQLRDCVGKGSQEPVGAGLR